MKVRWSRTLAVMSCLAVALLCFTTRVGVGPFSQASAQGDETTSSEIRFVELSKVKLSKKSGVVNETKRDIWSLHLQGKSKTLPIGTVVEFHVKWRRTILERFPVTIDKSRSFKHAFQCLSFDGFAKGLVVRSHIAYEDQSPEVRVKMDERPDEFWVDSSPWGDAFMDKTFDIGSAADLEKQEQGIHDYFKTTLQKLIEVDTSMRAERKKALDKTKFWKAGKFDSAKWQKWVKKHVRSHIKEIQVGIAANRKSLPFATHQRDLTTYLTDITNTYAFRTYDRSKKLYKELGLKEDPADTYPELKTKTRKRPTAKFLKNRVRQLCESQNIEGILPKRK